MSANTAPIFSATAHVAGTTFVTSDGTSKKTLLTPGSNGSRLDGIVICTNDTAASNVAFYINDGSTDYYLGNVPVAVGSGYTSVARTDALTLLAPPAVGALVLPSGYVLKANMVAAVTSAKTTTITVLGGDF